MHIADTISDGQTAQSKQTAACALDRRGFVRGALAMGAFALAPLALASLSGCSYLGIEDPTQTQVNDTPAVGADPGTVDFDGLTVTLNLNQTNWTWSQINNPASVNNGSLVVAVPVTVSNNDEYSRVLSYMYCKVTAPDGSVQSDISAYYTSDDILQKGSIAVGSSVSGMLHVLYRGPGTYRIRFDNLLGSKAELDFEVGDSSASGLRPIPEALSSAEVVNAVPYGASFDVSGLTLTFTSNEDTYWWTQTWDENDAVWNGRWVVGVPVTITNHSGAAATITADMYGLYAPGLYRLGDPSPWLSGDAACYAGPIQAGQTVQSYLFWPYVEDGMYYAVFDNNGAKALASVHILNY